MDLFDFFDRSNGLDSADALLELTLSATAELGFDRFAYCALTGHDQYEAGGNPAPAVAHCYPDSWLTHYFERGYQAIDPVLRFAPELECAFSWDSLSERFGLDDAQVKLMHEAGEAGLNDGIAVPLHGPHGRVCLMSFAASDRHPDAHDFVRKLTILAMQFHAVYREIGRSETRKYVVPSLTRRELECLKWAATGMSSAKISDAMNISQPTVTFHVRNVLKKLGAENRVEALMSALRLGLITLEYVPYEIE